MQRRTTRMASTLFCVVFALHIASPVTAASFQGLGDLPGGRIFSEANAVSADGSTVVGHSYSRHGSEAFRWTKRSGIVGLGGLLNSMPHSMAYGVSADGSVVVGTSYGSGAQGGGYEAFRWTKGGGMIGLGYLPGGATFGEAFAVSADGGVVVGRSNSRFDWRAFRWVQGGRMVFLEPLAHATPEQTKTRSSEARGISADGSVAVGQITSPSGSEAVLWKNGQETRLGELLGLSYEGSCANAASSDGTVVVGKSFHKPNSTEAFRWTYRDGITWLGVLPGNLRVSSALAVSANGNVIVGSANDETGYTAFIWDDKRGIRSLHKELMARGLDLAGWQLHEARGISTDGRVIVGVGINPNHQVEGWIADLRP